MVRRQGDTDNFLVIASEDAPVGKCGMRPDYLPAESFLNGLQDPRPANLLVAFGTEVGQDQIALVIEEDELVSFLGHQKDRGTIGLFATSRGKSFPELLAVACPEATQFAHGANPIDMAFFQD